MGLDAVEIIMGWEKAFGIDLQDDEVGKVSTPRQAINLIGTKVELSTRRTEVCLGLRSYHRIRQALCCVLGLSRTEIRLERKLREILPKKQRQYLWKIIFAHAGFLEAPSLGWGAGVIFLPMTVKDLVVWSVANHPKSLVNSDECWTYAQIRSVVRAVISNVCLIEDFSDDDDFVKDMGID